MKTKQEIWTSSDGKISVTIKDNRRGLMASLTIDDIVYNSLVATKVCGHYVMFFPFMGQYGQWAVPCLYDLTDDFGHRFQWLFSTYRRAVDELEWAVK